MKNKPKISKKWVFRLAIFVALAGIAYCADLYLEKNPVDFAQNQEEQQQSPENSGAYIFYNPQANFTAKPLILKAPTRFIHSQLHDKLLQRHHQLRNFFALKADNQNRKPPVQACFYILHNDYQSGSPDDPFLS